MKKKLIEQFFQLSFNTLDDDICVEVDSRKIRPGMIFFALEGQKTDGHLFLQEAFDKGAVFAVVSKTKQGLPFDRLIYVDQPAKTLQELARFCTHSLGVPIVGITGSCGKTTTKEYISQLMKTTYRIGKTMGNYNSQIGLAIALLAMKGDEEYLVLEMGMSEKGNIASLTAMAPPTYAVLTNIGVNHIEQFGSKERIAEEKGAIFQAASCQVAFIEKEAATYPSIQSIKVNKQVIVAIEDHLKEGSLHIRDLVIDCKKIPLGQEQFIKNLAMAVHVALELHVPHEAILRAIDQLQTLEHRFQMIMSKRCTIIDDSYNSSLQSLELAIASLSKKVVHGRKIAVIGAFAEQGELEALHHDRMADLLAGQFDELYFIGKPAMHCALKLNQKGHKAYYYTNLCDIVNRLNDEIQFNDLLFLKGANQYRLWEIVDRLPAREHGVSDLA